MEGIYGNGGVENTDGRQILMRSLAALHIHAMKIHRLLCNDRRRRPTGWIKSTLDYRLTLIDGSRYARFSKSLQFPKVLEILIISNESLSSSSSSFFDFVSPSVHLWRNKLEEYLRSVESFDSSESILIPPSFSS